MKPFDFYLSRNDEYVPDKYIPLSDFFLNPKYALPGYSEEEWVIGFKTLDEMRKKTFSQAKKRFVASGAKSFASFWNGNLDAINDAGINQFTKLSAFRELSGCMIAFEEKIISVTNRRNNRFISFGILIDNYEKYAESLRNAILNGSIPEKVNLYDPHKRRLNDLFAAPTTHFEFDGKDRKSQHKVTVNKIDLYYEFERWCKLKGKTKKQGIYEAIQALLEQNPIGSDDSQNVIAKKNEFGSLECVISSREAGEVTPSIKMPAPVYDCSAAIIRRFNSDPANISKKRLTMSAYVTQALSAFNKRVPLKYADPIAYQEYLAIKQAEEYNDSKRGDK